MRRVLRVAVIVAVVGCLVAFFSVDSGSKAAGARQESWFSIGQPWPWYENRMEQEVKPNGGLAASGEAGVILKSPAWFLLAGAVVGLSAIWLTRSRRAEVAPA